MPKQTWKEATLTQIKEYTTEFDTNVFLVSQLGITRMEKILKDTRSRTKNPDGLLLKTVKELADFKIVRYRPDLEPISYEYIPDNDNEQLIFKEKRSIGHIRITKCLDRLGIQYEEEKTFKDMVHKSFLRIDIYFEWCSQKVAVEYDGVQHQKAVDVWGGDAALATGQQRDAIKTQYCIDNDILLFRISHNVKNIEDYFYNCMLKVILLVLFFYAQSLSFSSRS